MKKSLLTILSIICFSGCGGEGPAAPSVGFPACPEGQIYFVQFDVCVSD